MKKFIATFSILTFALLPVVSHAALPSTGRLIKGSASAVYWYSNDGKRYVFPNEKTYKTWFPDFSGVVTVTDSELASVALGGNVTYRPGVKMVKIQSDPKTYAVDAGGTLRWVKSESVAAALYGSAWNFTSVEDLSDAFFVNYRVGADIDSANQFSPSAATAAATSIDVDLAARNATPPPPPPPPPPVPPVIITSSVSGTADAGLVIAGAQNVVLASFRLTASNEELKLVKVRVSLQDSASARNIRQMSLYDGQTLVGGPVPVTGSGNADFSNVNFVIPRNGSNTLTVTADLNTIAQGAQSGDNVAVLLHIPSSDDGTFEMRGTTTNTDLRSSSGGDILAKDKLVRKTIVTVANTQLPTTTLSEGTSVADRLTFTADAAEQVSLKKLTFSVSKSSGIAVSNPILREVGTNSNVTATPLLTNCGAGFGTCTVSLAIPSEIAIGAGTSRTFELRLDLAGTGSGMSVQTSLLGDATDAKGQSSNGGAGISGNTSYDFIWSDNSSIPHDPSDGGSNDWFTGIYVKNLPTDAQTLSR